VFAHILSLTEEHDISNTKIKVKYHFLGQLAGQCPFGSSFLPPVPGILASELLRTIRRKNSIPSAAGASAQPSAGRGRFGVITLAQAKAQARRAQTRYMAITGDVPEPDRMPSL
jgi:hypothetical protein